jgi:hypothetical protein
VCPKGLKENVGSLASGGGSLRLLRDKGFCGSGYFESGVLWGMIAIGWGTLVRCQRCETCAFLVHSLSGGCR